MRIGIAIAAIVVLAGVATAPGPVAAEESGILADLTDSVGSFVDGLLGAARGEFNRFMDEPADRDAAEAANDLQAEYNASSSAIESWVNERTTASADEDVLEIELDIGDGTGTLYLVADVAGSSYENSSLVDSTTRTVDETCELDDAAARNAPDELETFIEEFVDEDQDVSTGFLARLDRQYRGLVDCSFLDDG